jgi:hypothetical protein
MAVLLGPASVLYSCLLMLKADMCAFAIADIFRSLRPRVTRCSLILHGSTHLALKVSLVLFFPLFSRSTSHVIESAQQ